MILVTVGVSNLPFDRLLRAVDAIQGDEEVVAQCGASRVRPQGATCVAYLPYAEFADRISNARVVVCHAGIGSVGLCLTTGLHPIVVPRLQRFREAVDDHQLLFARRLGGLGLATVVEDAEEFPGAVRRAPGRQPPTGLSQQLTNELTDYIGRYV